MRRNSGLSLITAIFILLVLAALAAFIVSMSAVQQTDLALDLQGSRAYHAARSGLEFGAFQAINNNSCPALPQSVPLPAAQFDAFSAVTVTCSTGVPPATHNEAGVAKTLYVLVANACNQPNAGGLCPNAAPGANYVERELQLSVINPP
jgi:MSHA biogenesis protein MshP